MSQFINNNVSEVCCATCPNLSSIFLLCFWRSEKEKRCAAMTGKTKVSFS